jgi:hypothetical protein
MSSAVISWTQRAEVDQYTAREWSGIGRQERVETHQLLEPGKGLIRSGNKAETGLVGVPSKQLFLTVLAILLGMPDDPHFGNLEQGMCQNGWRGQTHSGGTK